LQVVCYYTNWSQYRPKHGKFLPEDIEPDLCTHIIFAFGWLKKGKLSSFESNDETKDGKVGLYERIMALKKASPKLKVLLAIGKFRIRKIRLSLGLCLYFIYRRSLGSRKSHCVDDRTVACPFFSP
jgi:GH18 family chitinase